MNCALYIHIPFCVSKCDYCDFFSVPCNKISDEYVDSLVKEINFYSKFYDVDSWSSVYVGGGTPSLLSENQINRLFAEIFNSCKNFDKSSCEITMELNPESITKEKLEVLEKNNVSRISVGIQSLNDNALKTVNRHCNSENALKALSLIKKYWKNQFNLDVIAGLPNQNSEEFVSSLKKIISFEPNHISMYTLTIEENTPLYKKIENGMDYDSDKSDEQWLLGKNILSENGYNQYEVSNFCRKGFESKHNMIYWTQNNYIGAGCSSCGTVYSENSGLRWNSTQNIKKYREFYSKYSLEEIKAFSKDELKSFEEKIPRETENLDLQTLEFEYLMMSLRTVYGADETVYKQKFSSVEPFCGNLEKRLGAAEGIWKEFEKEGRINVFND